MADTQMKVIFDPVGHVARIGILNGTGVAEARRQEQFPQEHLLLFPGSERQLTAAEARVLRRLQQKSAAWLLLKHLLSAARRGHLCGKVISSPPVRRVFLGALAEKDLPVIASVLTWARDRGPSAHT